MDLYNLDLEDVRLLLKLVGSRAEHLRTTPKNSFQEKEAGRLATLQKRLADEILHASQGR